MTFRDKGDEVSVFDGCGEAAEAEALDVPAVVRVSEAQRVAAFNAQMTDELWRRAESFARRWSRGIEYCGGRADAAYIADLVQDVFTDVLMGRLEWDPNQRSLASRVLFTIFDRTQREWKRVCKFQHYSVEVRAAASSSELESVLAETTPVSDPENARFLTEVVAWIREVAADDHSALAIVEGICAGFVNRADLMAATGLSPGDYKAARARLNRILAGLPRP